MSQLISCDPVLGESVVRAWSVASVILLGAIQPPGAQGLALVSL